MQQASETVRGGSRSTQGSSHHIWLLAMHVTSVAAERTLSAWGRVYTKARNRLGIDVATKLVAIKANLGSSEAPRGVDEMITLDHMADSGSD